MRLGPLEAHGRAVPGSGGYGLDCLPLPRGRRRRAKREAQWQRQARAVHEQSRADASYPACIATGLNDRDAPQCRLARLIASERAPTNMRLKAHVASRLNQLRDTNLRPK